MPNPYVTLKTAPGYRAEGTRDSTGRRLWNVYLHNRLVAQVYGNVQDARQTIRNMAALAA